MGFFSTRTVSAGRVRLAVAVGGAVLLGALATAGPAYAGGTVARGAGDERGLWPASFSPHQSAGECGQWRLDANGFCVADDTRNGLEVGVKFSVSRPVQVTGVRIYRVDSATVTGSLWDAAGERLATGRFAAGPTNAWQDLTFAAPVTVVPGQTYVASYFTPNTRYAFGYGYFSAARTVGPVTAQRSTDADPNGVHCYDDAACGSYPVRGFRDSTYWVTPLWVDTPEAPTTDPAAGVPGTAPRVLSVSPSGRAVRVTTKLHVTFSAAMRRSTITAAAVRLRGPDGPVPARLSYDATRHRVVIAPARRLRPRTTYRVVVSTRVRDADGNRYDQDPGKPGAQKGTWVVRTR